MRRKHSSERICRFFLVEVPNGFPGQRDIHDGEFAAKGFVRLLWISHIFWIPMVDTPLDTAFEAAKWAA